MVLIARARLEFDLNQSKNALFILHGQGTIGWKINRSLYVRAVEISGLLEIVEWVMVGVSTGQL